MKDPARVVIFSILVICFLALVIDTYQKYRSQIVDPEFRLRYSSFRTRGRQVLAKMAVLAVVLLSGASLVSSLVTQTEIPLGLLTGPLIFLVVLPNIFGFQLIEIADGEARINGKRKPLTALTWKPTREGSRLENREDGAPVAFVPNRFDEQQALGSFFKTKGVQHQEETSP